VQVSQSAFQPVADFDAHLAVAMDDEQQDAVILAGLAELPVTEQPVGKILERLATERIDGCDDDLVRRFLLEGFEPRGEGSLGAGIDNVGIVDDAACEAGEFGGKGCDREEKQQEKSKHPLTGPTGHLSPCPGERRDGRKVSANRRSFSPLPRAGGEVVC